MGKRYPDYTFRRRLHACAGKAGIDIQVTPHTFRRSCTKEMLRGGANMDHVKDVAVFGDRPDRGRSALPIFRGARLSKGVSLRREDMYGDDGR